MSSESVVHYPFTVPVPRPLRRQAMVQTLHDVQHLDLPHLFSRGERAYRRRFYDEAAKRADVVITMSQFAKRRIVESLGIAPERVVVAHLGVDTAAFVPNSGVRENFVLYPARGWEHKNHERLVAAMEILRTRIPGIRLVLTGGALESLGELPHWVDRRGLVSTEELRALYRSASALVFPSLYEGFGLPPLEAMASGCPTAVSNAGSIPEVCGNAAVLFDPLDPDAIADGVEEAIGRHEELSALGAVQVAEFTWKKCGEAHVTAYRQAGALR
jgi:glycosyltransferase involved in cell wall biosynthesis